MQHTLIDILWVITASALVFVMRAGFAMLESGMVRSKNSINVSVKVLTDLGVSLLAFWPLGFGLMFGQSQNGLVGTSLFFPSFNDVWLAVFFLFHAMFTSTAATIVSGAVAERIKYSSYMLVTLLFSAIIYPILGHWVWGGSLEGSPSGWLVKQGFLDFAGGTVVHATGGWISLAALIILGARTGRYNKDGTVNRITGAGLQTSVIGTILLWFGWFGFNGGSTLALNADVPAIILKTSLAGAAGMVVTLGVGWYFRKFPDVSLVINGALAGLVSATAGCLYISETSAIVIGAIGGLVMLLVEELLDRLKIDDAVTAIPVHLGAGIWGTLAVGIFGDPALLKTGLGWLEQINIQALGIVSCGAWAFGVAFVSIWIINRIFPIRVGAQEEAQGLNVMEHRASTEIYDLYKTLEDQARTGDLSLRAPVEPFTEVGQIAGQYNRVMDNLQENLVAKSEYVNILDNVHDGLLLLDRDAKIGPYYSSALEGILEADDLAGKDIRTVLQSLIAPGVLTSLGDFLDVLFDPQLEFRQVSRLNPLRKVDIFIDHGKGEVKNKHLDFSFRRIEENGTIVRLMVIVRDLTEQVEMEKAMESTRREKESEMELFYRIIHIDPQLLKEFLSSFDDKLDRINTVIESGQNVPLEVLKQAYRLVHGIKGEAGFLELEFIVDSAHNLEDLIGTLQKKKPLENSDFLALALKCGELQETGRRMSRLVNRLTTFQRTFVSQNRSQTHPLTVTLNRMFVKMGVEHHKKILVESDQFDPQLIPQQHLSKVKDILIQLGKNSIIHGIEAPEIRLARGKQDIGRITVKTEPKDGHVTVSVRDDGQGLDLEAIRQKAWESGLFSRQEVKNWSGKELVNLIFADGLSTADSVTKQAGRGVGMALVKDLTKSMKARLGVAFQPDEYMEIKIHIPMN